ncbi:MAG: hypothetical protein JEZ11_07855 [Desulfobacterales bacterium]|nr:hypothetical protein [Desulfobacterales bacterium]
MMTFFSRNTKSIFMGLSRLLFVAAVITALAGWSQAAEKKDFETALKNNGCKSIPYKDLQKKCVNEQKDVHRLCDRPHSCSSKNKDFKKIMKKLKKKGDKEKEIKARIKIADDCINQREAVMKVFDDTQDRLKKEKGDLAEMAKDLIKKIQSGESGHKKAIAIQKNAKKTCEGSLKGI